MTDIVKTSPARWIYTLLLSLGTVAYTSALGWVSSLMDLFDSADNTDESLDLERIQKDSEEMPKIPDHVALVVRPSGDVAAQLQEVCRACVWIWSIGTSVVTVFDEEGILQDSAGKCEPLIAQNLAKFKSTFHVAVSNGPKVVCHIMPHTQQHADIVVEPFRLVFLSKKNGKQRIAQIASQLANTRQQSGQTTDAAWLAEEIRKCSYETDVPDPQLMYVFGKIGSPLQLDGFPPWEIRLTEIWQVNTRSRRIKYSDILAGLHRFANTTGRFGK
ncbi:uncharacterized protein BJ171DRAFT_100375 [Polychytrium aggregatum]|uniref:uncharacterized protein n=1 Tax=Polychytrium aggregatum TaxID=110093 RepID=UPI0022FE4549|nr:uncharacterized protein BJ171DRAFT_100375 [Polychytrium aggregatum]KAI9204728.1 hypothetical protein BJ171DRAFT_100375 [Polychytrium aggregatum]